MKDNDSDIEIKAESSPHVPGKRLGVEGGILLFTPPNITARRRPCVVLGTFGNGKPAIHFRQYSLQNPDYLAPTRDGISLTLAELEVVYERVAAIMAATEKGISDAA